ncbi:chitinase [Verticillium alfalfae VaMs.102]|uniref:chitinase n=1 Tax=Verticillium alfalfae (strain VaMs.102 / ATCC MYA-4576 / FGSC 10136) TaxID=526221 RepID=C9SIJ4_VERA1|nr:chitinase [Verticillium alfalfae VaMs.102]EEY18767.1 chitinase [Verticillium alfalfae VaMs.102]
MLGKDLFTSALLFAAAASASPYSKNLDLDGPKSVEIAVQTVTKVVHLQSTASPTSVAPKEDDESLPVVDEPVDDLQNITERAAVAGYRNAVYFTNCVSSDTYADLEKHFPGDSWNEQGTNAYGCIKQLYLRKKKFRQLKLLLSIGGWTWSPKFAPVARTEAGRQRFASSAVALMADWGFDGIDIDWEYPKNANEALDFVRLLAACRQALDNYAARYAKGYRFQLTIAVPAGPTNYRVLDMKKMAPFVDGWHLMAYDYAGSWSGKTGHQSNLYRSKSNPAATQYDTETAVNYYLSQGINPSKVLLGVPLYGRSFARTDGLGKPYSGIGKGSIEAGVYHYKALPAPGAEERWDAEAVAAWSYDKKTRELVTYDNQNSVKRKADYLVKKRLGGAVFWESAGDRAGDRSLVRTVSKAMGAMDQTKNWLSYPASKYANIRKGMPGQ